MVKTIVQNSVDLKVYIKTPNSATPLESKDLNVYLYTPSASLVSRSIDLYGEDESGEFILLNLRGNELTETGDWHVTLSLNEGNPEAVKKTLCFMRALPQTRSGEATTLPHLPNRQVGVIKLSVTLGALDGPSPIIHF